MIVIDIETSGLDPMRHSIVSIGAVHLPEPPYGRSERFYRECRIDFGTEISDEALKINGFTRDGIQSPLKISVKEAVSDLFDWAKGFEDRTPAGMGVHFDIGFLRAAANRHGLEWPFGRRTVDLHTLIYAWYLRMGIPIPSESGLSKLSLNKALESLGFAPEPTPHNAMTGALLTARCLEKLIYHTHRQRVD